MAFPTSLVTTAPQQSGFAFSPKLMEATTWLELGRYAETSLHLRLDCLAEGRLSPSGGWHALARERLAPDRKREKFT